MVVDTSALVAILRKEPEAADFTRTLLASESSMICVPTLLETAIVIERLGGESAMRELNRFVEFVRLVPVAFGIEHFGLARRAYRDYGKGSGHPAGLNYGDCFAYALARFLNVPLLFKGDDFPRTDVVPAWPAQST